MLIAFFVVEDFFFHAYMFSLLHYIEKIKNIQNRYVLCVGITVPSDGMVGYRR